MPGLLDRPPLDLARAAARLRELRMRARHLGQLGLLLAAAGIGLVIENPGGPGVPLLIGSAAAFGLAGICRTDRRRLLVRLVSQGDAWAVAGVPELAERLLTARERRRLASGLRAAAAAGMTGSQSPLMVNPARADVVAERLVRLSEMLLDPAVTISAQAIALCRRLLTEPMHSPLYNPNVAELELPRVLDLVERGVSAH